MELISKRQINACPSASHVKNGTFLLLCEYSHANMSCKCYLYTYELNYACKNVYSCLSSFCRLTLNETKLLNFTFL